MCDKEGAQRKTGSYEEVFNRTRYSANENEWSEYAREHGLEIHVSAVPHRQKNGKRLGGKKCIPEECWMNNDNELAKWYRDKVAQSCTSTSLSVH